jgi:putative transposase
VRAIKSAKQVFQPDENMLSLMETFRQMVNECIRVGLDSDKTSMKALCKLCYQELKGFAVDSRYRLCAISRAAGILKNYRKLLKRHSVKIPYCARQLLTTCYGIRIEDGVLRLPSGVKIQLNSHTLKIISELGVQLRSVTLTPTSLSIAFAKSCEPMRLTGMIGLDRNLENITLADTRGETIRYDLSKVTHVRAMARESKRKFKRNDLRIRRLIFRKYSILEKNRTGWILHNVSSKIVMRAKESKMAITMENLRGIRRLYTRAGGHGRDYRFKMNSWSYRELQRQIDYKAKWEGIPVHYINPRGTSVTCSRCDDRMFVKEGRTLECPSCGLAMDRDVNAARNIVKGGLRFSPDGSPSEAMVAERKPSDATLIRAVDGGNGAQKIGRART